MLEEKIKNRLFVNKLFILNIFVSIVFCFLIVYMFNNSFGTNDVKTISFLSLIMIIYQIIILLKNGCRMHSFEIWFIVLSYLFMLGQIFLVGLFNLKTIEALGHVRPILDERYSINIICKSSLFALVCIHFIFSAFLLTSKKSCSIKKVESADNRLFNVSKILLLIGIPCHLIYSIRMILSAQSGSSYNAIVEYTGLIDDFSNFMIYGLICLLFSGRIKKNYGRFLIIIVTIYLLFVVIMTGDRRYQIVSIIVLLLSYLRTYDIKIISGFKAFITIIVSYLAFGGFYLIREIRASSLTNIISFFDMYKRVLFDFKTNILTQTLYEFGNSLYTVCLAFKYVPSVVNFKYGATILSGVTSIIPLGFMYIKSGFYLNGRLASELMTLGNTTVGGSVIADLYGNFGLIVGVICAFVVGVLLNSLFYKSEGTYKKSNYFLARYYILFFALLHIVRASFTEVIRTSVWGIFVLFILYKILGGDKNEKKSRD